MTQGEAVAKAHRQWTEDKLTGELTFVYRHGRVQHVRHGRIDFVDGEPKSVRADVPTCPACGQPMRSRDSGAMWACEACGVKRTEAQLKRV